MTYIIAISNQKGGVGKSTTTAALGAALQDAGQTVILVDCDPQGSLTDALGVRDAPPVFYEAMMSALRNNSDPPDLGLITLPGGERLLPATLELAGVELDLVGATRREYVLADLLADLTRRTDAPDWILLDCPPSLGLLTINALTAADTVIIPVTPEHMAVRGLKLLLSTIRRVRGGGVRAGLNPRLTVAGIVITMLTGTTHHKEQRQLLVEAATALHLPILADIPRRTAVQAAAGAGVAPTRYPDTNGAGAAYTALAAHLITGAPHA